MTTKEITSTEMEKLTAWKAAYDRGYEIGARENTASPAFKGAWNHCDDLGIARGSVERKMFTNGFLDALHA